MLHIKRLTSKLFGLIGAAALLLVAIFGGYNGVKAASGTVDLVAVGTGHHNLYYIGMPGDSSCTAVKVPVVDRLSDTATFTVRPHTRITSVKTEWGDKWSVDKDNVVTATKGMTLTGLDTNFMGAGTATVKLPHGISSWLTVCYAHVGTDKDDTEWRAYGLGSDPKANVVKLPFKEEGVAYNHTLNLDAGDHSFPGGFIAYKVDVTATGITFVVYDQTKVEVTVFGDGFGVKLDVTCTGTTCVANFPDGTTRADWSAPSVVYDWDGTGKEPATTGVNVSATNALP